MNDLSYLDIIKLFEIAEQLSKSSSEYRANVAFIGMNKNSVVAVFIYYGVGSYQVETANTTTHTFEEMVAMFNAYLPKEEGIA